MSRVQVIPADSIDALATVLTPVDYSKYISHLPKHLASGVYMCYREFKNNKVMRFSLSELKGYSNQTIFTMLCSQPAHLKSKGHMLHEVKDITREGPSTQGLGGCRTVSESGHSGIRKSIPGNQIAKAKPPTCPMVDIKFPSIGPVGIQLVEPQYKLSFEVGDNLEVKKRNQLAKAKPPTCPMVDIKFPSIGPVGIQLVEPQCKLSFEVGDNLEVLCQDSGMRGCWFRCKVLKVSQKRMKVQYDDIQDCEGPEKLEEWVPSYRVAGSDKLGMRCTGRLTVRPRPLEDSSDYFFEVGAAVDAWWSDGWWEGVVAEFDVSGSGHHQVYFPGENMLLEIQRKNLRTSRDWTDGKWAEVKGKKDIKSFIRSSLTDLSKCSIKEPGNCENQMAPKLVAMKTTNCSQLLNNQLRSKTTMLLN